MSHLSLDHQFVWLVVPASFAASMAVIWLLLRYWRVNLGLDLGDLVRKAQNRPILRLGGVGVFAGLVVASIFEIWVTNHVPGFDGTTVDLRFLFCCGLIFILGLMDDLYPATAGLKLVGQLAVATVAYFLGFQIRVLGLSFLNWEVDLDGFSYVVTVFWLIAIPNIINMVDGMDGLAGGIGFALTVTLGVVSLLSGWLALAVVCLGVAGAIAGFLVFNLPPAKIYLGDGGAYLIGFFIALASTVTSQKGAVAASMSVVLIALAFPIADAAFAILRRTVYGLPIFRSDAEHLHHRLLIIFKMRKGWLLGVLYGVFLLLSLLGLSVYLTKGYALPIAIGGVFCVLLAGMQCLGLFQRRDEVLRRIQMALRSREDVAFAHDLGRILHHELKRQSSAVGYWKVVDESLKRVGLSLRPDGNGIGPAGEWSQARISLMSRAIWTLYYRPSGRQEMNWERLAQCFVPAVCGGLRKWRNIPAEFDIVWDEPKLCEAPALPDAEAA